MSRTAKRARCPNGKRKNVKTGVCEGFTGARGAVKPKSSVDIARRAISTDDEVKLTKSNSKKRCPNGSRKNKKGDCVGFSEKPKASTHSSNFGAFSGMSKAKEGKSPNVVGRSPETFVPVFTFTVRKSPRGEPFTFSGDEYWEERTMMENIAEKLGISELDILGDYNEHEKKYEYLIVHRPRDGMSVAQIKNKVTPFKNRMFQANYTDYKPTSNHAVNGEDVYVMIK